MCLVVRVATKSGSSCKIREFYFQSGRIRGKGDIFQKIREDQETLKFLIFSFLSSNFLRTQSCVQLSVIVAKFCPFLYHYVLCSHFETQFRFVMSQKFAQPKIDSRLCNEQVQNQGSSYLSNEIIEIKHGL